MELRQQQTGAYSPGKGVFKFNPLTERRINDAFERYILPYSIRNEAPIQMRPQAELFLAGHAPIRYQGMVETTSYNSIFTAGKVKLTVPLKVVSTGWRYDILVSQHWTAKRMEDWKAQGFCPKIDMSYVSPVQGVEVVVLDRWTNKYWSAWFSLGANKETTGDADIIRSIDSRIKQKVPRSEIERAATVERLQSARPQKTRQTIEDAMVDILKRVGTKGLITPQPLLNRPEFAIEIKGKSLTVHTTDNPVYVSIQQTSVGEGLFIFGGLSASIEKNPEVPETMKFPVNGFPGYKLAVKPVGMCPDQIKDTVTVAYVFAPDGSHQVYLVGVEIESQQRRVRS